MDTSFLFSLLQPTRTDTTRVAWEAFNKLRSRHYNVRVSDVAAGETLKVVAEKGQGSEFQVLLDMIRRRELEVYREFSALCEKYAFLVGFNSGHRPSFQHTGGWDLPYLVARARRMGYAFDYSRCSDSYVGDSRSELRCVLRGGDWGKNWV